MKVLTIYQPWASLIIVGAKPYEFRGWPVPLFVVNQRIGIHASARPVDPAELDRLVSILNSSRGWKTLLVKEKALPLLELAQRDPDKLPRAAIIGSAVVGDPIASNEIAAEFGAPVNDSDRHEHSKWAWPMRQVITIMPPLEARGQQGLWTHGGIQ